MRKQKVLFLCTQNSARSQMAEAFLRKNGGDRFEVYSAGCEVVDEVHPYATEVMEEVGIDISEQYPKGLRTDELYAVAGQDDALRTPAGRSQLRPTAASTAAIASPESGQWRAAPAFCSTYETLLKPGMVIVTAL